MSLENNIYPTLFSLTVAHSCITHFLSISLPQIQVPKKKVIGTQSTTLIDLHNKKSKSQAPYAVSAS